MKRFLTVNELTLRPFRQLAPRGPRPILNQVGSSFFFSTSLFSQRRKPPIGRLPYPLTENLSQNAIRKVALQVVENYADLIEEFLPDSLRGQQNLIRINDAYRNIHFPETMPMAAMAPRTSGLMASIGSS